MKPVCKKCGLFFRAKKNGFFFVEGMPVGGGVWKPYKIWLGDLWGCQGCGAEIVIGVGREPISEHYQPGFSEMLDQSKASQLQVNDC